MPDQGMIIGIYGGTFDPPHKGHLMVAREVMRSGLVDEVWLMVSPCNPLKNSKDITQGTLRLDMCRKAVERSGLSGVKVSDFEFSLPVPSYSIDTLRKLSETFPHNSFRLIVGEDNLDNFDLWRNPEEILSRFGLIVYPRPGSNFSRKQLPDGCQMLSEVPEMMVSSTEIRKIIKNTNTICRENKELENLLNPEVLGFIRRHNLYS